jgi:VanZ like family
MKKLNYALVFSSFILIALTLLPLSMMPRISYLMSEVGHVSLFFVLSLLAIQKIELGFVPILSFAVATIIELTQKTMNVGRHFGYDDIFWDMIGAYAGLLFFRFILKIISPR